MVKKTTKAKTKKTVAATKVTVKKAPAAVLGIKVRKAIKPATKSRKGRNPFTGEEITISAKPKRTTAKVTALKALKELV